MDLKELKKEMRARIRNKITGIDENAAKESNKLILDNLLSLKEIKNAKTIFCFVGTKKEVDTAMFIELMLRDGKRIGVPLCVKEGIMEAREITDLSQLKPGKYGILEPDCDSIVISRNDIDTAVIPCVTCDRECNRLGQGGGYYDRFLASGFHKIAICREILLVDKVPIEAFDQPVDMVVTEKNVYYKK